LNLDGFKAFFKMRLLAQGIREMSNIVA
jgi:hypothetical protein